MRIDIERQIFTIEKDGSNYEVKRNGELLGGGGTFDIALDMIRSSLTAQVNYEAQVVK